MLHMLNRQEGMAGPLAKRFALALLSLAITACSGGGSSPTTAGGSPSVDGNNEECVGQCTNGQSFLTEDDVKTVVAQAVLQAQDLGQQATIAVSDRVGNVLLVFRMAGADDAVTLSTVFPNERTVSSGLDGVALPSGSNADALAAISKAVTGAYLSSEGNAFSSRTANQIVQENFNPGEDNQPAGPLFGVQFSQLGCSDFSNRSSVSATTDLGPMRSPFGLSADPGGLPLYKAGALVGGVGVMADNRYSIDKSLLDTDNDIDEIIATAATAGYGAPDDRRADRITVDGKTLRFSDVRLDDIAAPSATAATFDSFVTADGSAIAVQGYTDGSLKAGTVFGQPSSGIRADNDVNYPDLDAFVFVDAADNDRFAPRAGTDGALLMGAPMSENEARVLMQQALAVANEARAQIRRPLNSQARVTISIVDTQGEVLAMARTRDAPVFGADVSLQKARTAALFSSRTAAQFFNSITTPPNYLQGLDFVPQPLLSSYVDNAQAFIDPNALTDGIAFTDRAGGNLSRPFYPDGIEANGPGPFSKRFDNGDWSVFSTGLQLDMVINNVLTHVVFATGLSATDAPQNCVNDVTSPRAANGIQIFPGSVPVYRGEELIGGIGVSGDGIDQDDMISFLGLHRAGLELGGSIGNAPLEMRADQLTPQGTRLRYVQCPQAPFINSDDERVCDGL